MRRLYVYILLLPFLAGCSLDLTLTRHADLSSIVPDTDLLLPEQAKSTNFYPGTLCSRQVDGSTATSTCFDNPFSVFKDANPLQGMAAREFDSGGRGTLSGEPSCFIASATGKVYCSNISDTYLRMKEVDLSSIAAKTNLHKLAVGSLHKCILDDNGQAYCWGSNGASGTLGNNSTIDSDNVPVPVDVTGSLAGKTLTTVSAGEFHTCVLDSAGAGYCWGFGGNGRLGDGSSLTSKVPVAVNMSGLPMGRIFDQIATGYGHTCAIDDMGSAYCWGEGTGGKLGNGGVAFQNVPVAVTGDVAGKVLRKVTIGFSHTCAIDSGGKAYCWGSGNQGQLGNSANPNIQNTAVAVTVTGVLSGKTLIDISAGSEYTCAADSDGATYCWGRNFGNAPVLVSAAAAFGGKK